MNRGRRNAGHRALNGQRKRGVAHRTSREAPAPAITDHTLLVEDATTLLRSLPTASVQLVVCDPPYNVQMASWDNHTDYLAWCQGWLSEVERVLAPSGSLALFGGLQFQGEAGSGDLLTLLAHLRGRPAFRLVNLIVWAYPQGTGAARFFSSRHEEIAWLARSPDYYFDLDAVREPYDDATRARYGRDPRLRAETLDRGKNPTNVWHLPRLNGNSRERVGHPTQKPRAVIRRLVRALSWPGAIVVDPFAGSAVTGRVCIEEARHCILGDVDPALLDYHTRQCADLALATTPHRQVPLEDHPVHRAQADSSPISSM